MKSNLYTGTGDTGTTSLVGGQRINKCSERLEAYGTLDEFSAFLGVVLSSPDCPQDLKIQMLHIQNRLFDVGCYLATPSDPSEKVSCKGIGSDEISMVERWIDILDAETPKIRNFILPGGTMLSAHCHVARTVCRRAERRIFALASTEYVDPMLLRWINRLSDYLFIATRVINHRARVEEIQWGQALEN